jgi:hypothetical protein
LSGRGSFGLLECEEEEEEDGVLKSKRAHKEGIHCRLEMLERLRIDLGVLLSNEGTKTINQLSLL